MIQTSELQLRLAQIVSILAAIATLSVWRANVLPQITREFRVIRRQRLSGYYPQWVETAYYVRLCEVVLWVFGLGLSAGFLWYAYHFFVMINSILTDTRIDIVFAQHIRNHADGVRDAAVMCGVSSIAVLLLQWVITLSTPEWKVPATGIVMDTHPFVVPSRYKGSKLALWEYRFERTREFGDITNEFMRAQKNASWRSGWTEWVRCVFSTKDVTDVIPDMAKVSLAFMNRVLKCDGFPCQVAALNTITLANAQKQIRCARRDYESNFDNFADLLLQCWFEGMKVFTALEAFQTYLAADRLCAPQTQAKYRAFLLTGCCPSLR